jgi:3-hydroxyisobutyrate dehydrogenase
MAACLVGAGFRLRVYDINQKAISDFVGAHPAALATASPRAAAQGADALITILPDGRAVQQALLEGPEAASAGLARGALAIDMSSSAPTGTVELAAALGKLGLPMIDAPVSGGVKRAIDGSLAIIAGGDAAEVERARPLLLAMGKSLHHTGAIGSGHAMKALNNYLSAATLTTMCEALAIGQRFGLDPNLMVDVLNSSSGRSNSTEGKARQFILSGAYNSGFTVALMAKDLGIAAGLAGDLGLEAEALEQLRARWDAARKSLGDGADHTEIYKVATSKR